MHTINTLSPEDALDLVLDAPWGVAIVGVDFKFQWVNPAYCRILEAPADLILNSTFGQWTHHDDVDIDIELATKVRDGLIPGYTLSKRYIKRLSTPQNPRIVCGMLSVMAKWEGDKLKHYRVHFQPFESTQPVRSKINFRELAQWTKTNWKAILTAVVFLLSLTSIGSERLLEILQRAKNTAESVDGVLSRSPPGQQQQP